MISRSRSGPTVAAMSIECTTSANRTVTRSNSADRPPEFGGDALPHDAYVSPVDASLLTLAWFHYWPNGICDIAVRPGSA
jgi:hypothetical protein